MHQKHQSEHKQGFRQNIKRNVPHRRINGRQNDGDKRGSLVKQPDSDFEQKNHRERNHDDLNDPDRLLQHVPRSESAHKQGDKSRKSGRNKHRRLRRVIVGKHSFFQPDSRGFQIRLVVRSQVVGGTVCKHHRQLQQCREQHDNPEPAPDRYRSKPMRHDAFPAFRKKIKSALRITRR